MKQVKKWGAILGIAAGIAVGDAFIDVLKKREHGLPIPAPVAEVIVYVLGTALAALKIQRNKDEKKIEEQKEIIELQRERL